MKCTDCAHSHDEVAEMPFIHRIFACRTMFSIRCDLPAFADPVDGAMAACISMRLMQCNGLPPKFVPRDKPDTSATLT